MSDDKNILAISEADQDESADKPSGFRLGARLGSNVHSSIDLPSSLPDDEEAVAAAAQRFRRPGGFGQVSLNAPSLDSKNKDDPNLSAAVLEGALIDALDTQFADEKSDYVLEEVPDDPSLDGLSQRRNLRSRTGHPPQGRAPEQAPATLACPHCGAMNPEGMRYCVQCGGSLQVPKTSPLAHIQAPARQPPPPSEAARQANPWEIFLISINEDGSDGVNIPLEFLETTVGREGDTRFPTDAFLSPKHARLHIERGQLYIEDLYSLNGTFLKLRDEVKLTPGDTFLMGRQVLRFERFEQSISPKTKSSDGTRYMGSPSPGGTFKLLQIGIGGIIQNVYCLPEVGAVLGREKGDIIFPHDKFMSSRHAQIYKGEDDHCYLVDLTSSNGTWIKIWEKTELRHNDYIFMGQQLFRVTIKEAKK
ncbi:MAG: FHA domain-containing protein [Myxococcota bacterium]